MTSSSQGVANTLRGDVVRSRSPRRPRSPRQRAPPRQRAFIRAPAPTRASGARARRRVPGSRRRGAGPRLKRRARARSSHRPHREAGCVLSAIVPPCARSSSSPRPHCRCPRRPQKSKPRAHLVDSLHNRVENEFLASTGRRGARKLLGSSRRRSDRPSGRNRRHQASRSLSPKRLRFTDV